MNPRYNLATTRFETYPEFDELFEAFDIELGDQEWQTEVNRSSAEYVRWVQQSLNKIMGLRLAVDGINGPMTRSAVRSFQQRRGLTVDGIVGPQTEGALIRAGASSPPSSAGTPAQIPTAPLPVPPAPSTGFFKDLPDLQTVNLSPSSPVAINSGWPIARRTIASIYNRLGGLMSAIAGKTQIEVPAVLAVWKVEGGNLPHNPGKAVIRFENHLLYRLWGKNNDATYAQYFRHGGYMGQSGNPWENHQYREDPNQPFRSSHSNQDAEYLALGLAARLASEEIALQCISIGGPQILISNYSLIGYRTPREMYNAFQASERSQVLGFFDYCQQKEKEKGGLLPYLRAKDFRNFAYYYNGPGQVDYYGRMIQEAYNEARQIPFELDPEFEGDFEGEEEWGHRRSFPRGGVGPSTARTLIEAGVSQPPKDEGQELFEYGYYGEIPLGAADYELEEEVNRQSPEYAMWVQQSLNKILGLRLAVDGITGTQTRSAIRSFQQREGLLVDGIVGPQTEGALIRAGAGNPPGTAPAPYIPGGWPAPPAGRKELSGAIWVSRFPTSRSTSDLEPTFANNVNRFISALKAAGASVSIAATYRPQERAYLMHWAWKIANGAVSAQNVPPMSGVEINWWHGNDADSRRAAQEMVNAYDIVRQPSLTSRHIERRAIDMSISWSGNLQIKKANGQPVLISSSPKDGTNPSLIEVGRSYNVVHFQPPEDDPPHWSVDGR